MIVRWISLCAVAVWLSGTVPAAEDPPPRLRLVDAPPHARVLDSVQPLDADGGPVAEGAEFRALTPVTQAEWDAADPTFRSWARAIAEGRADKRIMRLYWFYRSRLDPFDRRVPEDWRERGLAVLRDARRTAEAIRAAEARRRDALRDDAPVTPPPGELAKTSDRLRGNIEGASAAAMGIGTRGVWVPIGPFSIPGRMTGLDRPAGEPLTLYAAAADGGLWRTRDGGVTWETLTDFEATLSGGAVLLDPNDPNVIYFGTGEGNGAIDNYPGIGVLKSTDGGLTWSESNEFSSAVRRLAMHPSESNRIYAAGDAGCYVSDDAGATFTLIGGGLPQGTGASDVLVRPDDPDTVFCAIWGGANGGIYRSTDHGVTWTLLANGLPAQGSVGRIALAVSRSNPDVLIAGIDENGGTVYRTTDGGDTWSAVPGNGLGSYCGGQCWYDNHVAIDPANADVLYAGGIDTYRSDDGGVNWIRITSSSGGRAGNPDYVHVDQHFIFTPESGEVLLANDGGVYRSTDFGGTWDEWSQGMDTTQYYGICRHPTEVDWAFGGTQDNGSHRRRTGDDPPWEMVLGGDGGMCMAGPPGTQIIVGEYQNHNMQRSTNDGVNWASANDGIRAREPRPWVGILEVDPSDRNHMWTSTYRIYRSLDARATSWVSVSGPLYFNLSASSLAVAPSDSNVVYAGFDGGGLFVSSNALAESPTWLPIRDDAQQPMRGVRRIRVHPDDADTVYVVFNGYGAGKIWKSTDRGATWADRTGDLPDVPVNDLFIDADQPGTLLAATDLGVFRSDDDGATWYGFSAGLPTVSSIMFTYDRAAGRLRLGTHGRSMWEWQPSQDAPAAVPDGAFAGGNPMTADRIGADQMRVRWDTRTCTAWSYQILYGDLDDVASRTYSGAYCDVGTAGEATVPIPATPSGNVFFVVVATDGSGTEGPHGYDRDGNPVNASGTGFCGIAAQDALATCP